MRPPSPARLVLVLALALGTACTCGEESEGRSSAPETSPEKRLRAVRDLVQKLSNARNLEGWQAEVDDLAKRTGLAKNELRWRVRDLVAMHRTCVAVATADDGQCDLLVRLSADAAIHCRHEAGFYGILCGRMMRRGSCTGDDADRVAALMQRERDWVERTCRRALGEPNGCTEPTCESWAGLAKAVKRARPPKQWVRDTPIYAAVSVGHAVSCDAALVRSIEARLADFVNPPAPLVPEGRP